MAKLPVIRFLFLLTILLILFASCNKEHQTVPAKIKTDSVPFMSAHNIDVLFSDSGKVEARLTAPLLNQYSGQNPRMEFPKGFKLYMYDSVMRVQSTITARYGIRYDIKDYMEGRGDVIVRNELKKEQLNTEHLIWDERNHRIYNNEPIKVTTPGKILYGNDLESDEGFTRYNFKNPTGEMKMKKDSV
jgi:LPS export ABC transporter protein LptC